jgi:hypothetical protein
MLGYNVEIDSKSYQYFVLGHNVHKKNNNFSIVLRNFNEEYYENYTILYTKMNNDLSPDVFFLDEKEKSGIMDLIEYFKHKGVRFSIYGKKEMYKAESLEFIRKYNLSLSGILTIDEVFKEFENNLTLLCVIFLEDEVKPGRHENKTGYWA